MIIIKSDPEIDIMRQAGRITAGARTIARQMVAPGVTTRQINREVHKFITKSGATPGFMTDGGFPTAACISVNDEIIHGIPVSTSAPATAASTATVRARSRAASARMRRCA